MKKIVLATLLALAVSPAFAGVVSGAGSLSVEGLSWKRDARHADEIRADFSIRNDGAAVKWFYLRCQLSDASGARFEPSVASVDQPLAPGTNRFRDILIAADAPDAVTEVNCGVSMYSR